jgi:predicted NBD/HSP70 family sugar kinase
MSTLEMEDGARAALRPPLDPGFDPMIRHIRAAQVPRAGGRLAIAVERAGGGVARYDLPLPAEAPRAYLARLAERVVKFMLWSAGGRRVMLAGPEALCRSIREEYSEDGPRAFDAGMMKTLYGGPLMVERRPWAEIPEAADTPMALGGHFNGDRLGFDLGASDFKICAMEDGRVVFSEEIPWDPKNQPDPAYHHRCLTEGLKKAAAHLPRVDAIGGSTAGVVVENRIMIASLFRAVPPDRYAEASGLFLRLRREWQVPVETANDGDVTALAGALSLKQAGILGVAMGSSEAAGYWGRTGALTGRLSELAFAPVDFNPEAAADEWSGDHGVGAMSFSQQAVNRLAPAAGFAFPDGMPLPERLVQVQAHMAEDDPRARRIYETIGVHLGWTVPWYREFYDFDHLLILGRVTSGPGGALLLETARAVLREQFPELADRVEIRLPDERSRRVGQCVAAASLPEVTAWK